MLLGLWLAQSPWKPNMMRPAKQVSVSRENWRMAHGEVVEQGQGEGVLLIPKGGSGPLFLQTKMYSLYIHFPWFLMPWDSTTHTTHYTLIKNCKFFFFEKVEIILMQVRWRLEFKYGSWISFPIFHCLRNCGTATIYGQRYDWINGLKKKKGKKTQSFSFLSWHVTSPSESEVSLGILQTNPHQVSRKLWKFGALKP